MILRQIERIRRSRTLDRLVVATSTDRTDDELFELLLDEGIEVRRGPLDDVLSRFVRIVDELSPKTVIRLTGDNPLVDPEVIDLVVDAHLATGVDYTSNSLVHTFPHGLDVECVRTEALRKLIELELDAAEREHVTLGIYTRPSLFSLHAVTQRSDHSDLRWTVDYPDDFAFVEAVYGALYAAEPAFGQEDVLALISRGEVPAHRMKAPSV